MIASEYADRLDQSHYAKNTNQADIDQVEHISPWDHVKQLRIVQAPKTPFDEKVRCYKEGRYREMGKDESAGPQRLLEWIIPTFRLGKLFGGNLIRSGE